MPDRSMKRRSHSHCPVGAIDVVCDPGTSSMKAGLIGDELPRVEFFRNTENSPMNTSLSGGGVLSTGVVTDSSISDQSDPVEQWEHVLASLKPKRVLRDANQDLDARLGSIVVSENMFGKKSDRERMVEYFFEFFRFGAVNISSQAGFVLAASATTTGVVVDAGETKTQIIPVTNGFVQIGNVKTVPVGGHAVTKRLIDALKRGNSVNQNLDECKHFHAINLLKETHCYIAQNVSEERLVYDITNKLIRSAVLPDGTPISMNKERFLAPEILFEPKFFASESLGVCSAIEAVIHESPIDARASLLGSIIPCGGVSLTRGFSDRIRSDLNHLGNVHVHADPDRKHSAFAGASVMAQVHRNNPEWWLTAAEYTENGAGAIHRFLKLNI